MTTNRRRIERDPEAVLDQVAHVAGVDRRHAERVVAAIRAVIDDLLADGYVVAVGELVLSFGDGPTWSALPGRLAGPAEIPEPVLRGQHEAIAEWLGLSMQTYAEQPLANLPILAGEVRDLLGDEAFDRNSFFDILEAWDATFAEGRRYRVGNAGLEVALEKWLVTNVEELAKHGFPVRLEHQQHVFPDRSRPDLICRFTRDAGGAKVGDWLVVELKARRLHEEAVAQIQRYLRLAEAHLAQGDESVHGLLVTDGGDHADLETLHERGIGHLSLAALGYRLHLERAR